MEQATPKKKTVMEKLKGLAKSKVLLFSLIGGLGLGAGVWKISHSTKEASQGTETESQEQASSSKKEENHGFFYQLTHSFSKIKKKAKILRRADEENDLLRLENASLRNWAESLKFNCALDENKKHTSKAALRMSEETGARVGRTLAGIDYRPPSHLLPDQLYTLAISYLKAEEMEKSSVLLTFLTGLDDNDTYKTPQNYLMTGLSWYQMDHFHLANEYFDEVIKFPADESTLKFQAQARLWKALTAKKLNQHDDSQKWLTNLLDHHPRSPEASWVNSMEGAKRATSSVAH